MKTANYFKNVSLTALLVMGSFVYAQDAADADNIAEIKEIAEKACDCTYDISVEIPKDSIISSINQCIIKEIINKQMNNEMEKLQSNIGTLLENAVTSEKDTVIYAGDGETSTILVDKNFEEIQAYMFKNCKNVRHLMIANNVTSEKSMSKNKKALDFYKEGQLYDSQGKYNLAVVSYNKAVKADPKFAFAWDNMGYSYRKMENYKQAIECYKKSLEIDPYGSMPLLNISVAYMFLKDYKNASLMYDRLIDIESENPEGYYGGARAYYFDGNYEKGVDYMFKAYLLYKEAQSPYINDAQQNLTYYYQDLKEKDKLDIFMQAAKNNNIDIKE